MEVQSLRNSNVVEVAAGNGFSILRTEDGAVYTCGMGDYGQTGHGNAAERYVRVPRVVRALTSKKVKSVAAGVYHAACCTEDGEVYCWGLGQDGQIGIGSTSVHNAQPQRVTGLKGEIVCQVSCGSGHTAAVTQDGKVFVWGRGSDGQLGQGKSGQERVSEAARRLDPVELQALRRQGRVSQLSLGGDFSMAVVTK